MRTLKEEWKQALRNPLYITAWVALLFIFVLSHLYIWGK